MVKTRNNSILKQAIHRVLVLTGAAAMTLMFFMVLPLMQTISKPPTADLVLQNVDTGEVPPPPPAPEEPPPPEDTPPPPPPALADEAPPLDLSQLELAMNPGISDGWLTGDFAVKLTTVTAEGGNVDALFSLADLDQKPRVIYQPSPVLTREIRAKAPGTVYIIFIVDKNGRVDKPKVQSSTDPIFEKPALQAVRQWKFEPGKRGGQSVRFRMRVPITFQKGR